MRRRPISLVLGTYAAAAAVDVGALRAEWEALQDAVVVARARKAQAELAQRGGAEPAPSLEVLRASLAAADEASLRGDYLGAAAILHRIVETPAFASWKTAVEHDNAEYAFGRALGRAGAHVSSRRPLLRVLERGPGRPYFAPALRALVDSALETREHAGVLALLDKIEIPGGLPRDGVNETEYLAGKGAYDRGDLAAAELSFGRVDRTSRFYASATYFRGLIAARRADFNSARGAFCEVATQRDTGRVSFFIDGRYFAVKDLAHLALGRISHEQGRYEESYYHYFQVPQESERLPEAVFEAAWSMFQKGEHRAARAFIDQFETLFPASPLAPEVTLLRAHLDIRACGFDRARAGLAALEQTYVPVRTAVRTALADAGFRHALMQKLAAGPKAPAAGSPGTAGTPGDRLSGVLRPDPQLAAVQKMLAGLPKDAGDPKLAARTEEIRAKLVQAGDALAQGSLLELDARLASLLRQSRLAHIDAVIGRKKRLQAEIISLNAGRFPRSLFRTLALDGLLADDEEYWPFEGEYWSDEYERYR